MNVLLPAIVVLFDEGRRDENGGLVDIGILGSRWSSEAQRRTTPKSVRPA